MRRLPDQIGACGCAGKYGCQAFDAALLGLATRDPENIGIDRPAPATVASAFVALESLTNTGLADVADLFHAMRQARKAGNGGGDDPRMSLTKDLGGGKGQRGILPIVRAHADAALRSIAMILMAARPFWASYNAPSTTKNPRPSTLPTETGFRRCTPFARQLRRKDRRAIGCHPRRQWPGRLLAPDSSSRCLMAA